jgi:hypothetical protein
LEPAAPCSSLWVDQGFFALAVETSIHGFRFLIVSSLEGSLTPECSYRHGSESGVHHEAQSPVRLSDLGVVGRTAAGNPAKNVSVRNCLVARPLDNGSVNIPVTLKFQPFSSDPESHAQILSDRRDGLEITFEEPSVVRVHCILGLADLTQSGS